MTRMLAILVAVVVMLAACASDDAPIDTSAEAPSDSPQETTADDAVAEEDDDPVPAPTADTAPIPGYENADGTTLRFADITVDAGVAVSHASPFGSQKDGAEMMGGAAAGDFDNDGNQDLFFIGGGENPDRLFMNQGDGTFVDMAESAGLTYRTVGSGATVGDYDGDGWLDIFVSTHGTLEDGQIPGRHHLYRNNGDGTFTDVAEAAGVNLTSRDVSDGFGAAFGDIDLDGDLDLFVAGWVRESMGNRLFLNNGDGTFDDVTEDVGIVDFGIRGFSPCIVDMDGDRYPEILLVSDFGTTQYLRNVGDGTFEHYERSRPFSGEVEQGMGTAIGDFNNDGLIDWYTTAIHDDDSVGRGLGNRLYINLGDHDYDQVAEQAGVDDGGWGWGTVAVDLDLDGRLDIVETNGWRLPSYDGEMAKVFMQTGDLDFVEVADDSGLRHSLFGLSVVNFDIDNDGDQDIAITAGNDRFYLYETRVEGAANWLRVMLDTTGTDLAPNGIGAVVQVDAGGQSYYDTIVGCSNYLSSGELSAHFGLGETATIDRVTVEWPDGTTSEIVDVAVNQTLTVRARTR